MADADIGDQRVVGPDGVDVDLALLGHVPSDAQIRRARLHGIGRISEAGDPLARRLTYCGPRKRGVAGFQPRRISGVADTVGGQPAAHAAMVFGVFIGGAIGKVAVGLGEQTHADANVCRPCPERTRVLAAHVVECSTSSNYPKAPSR